MYNKKRTSPTENYFSLTRIKSVTFYGNVLFCLSPPILDTFIWNENSSKNLSFEMC